MSSVQQKRASPAEKKLSKSLAASYRRFAGALESFNDFGAFSKALDRALRDDPVLAGAFESVAAVPEEDSGRADVFAEGQVVLPVGGKDGYVLVEGRRDRKPFGPEDLHLMGALAEFVSALVTESRAGERSRQTAGTLRFILDQLPLGVVCFDADRSVLVRNRVAESLTGDLEADAMAGLFLGKPDAKLPEHVRFHFEAGGKLVYAEGRSLSGGSAATHAVAFFLFDMGGRRDRLLAELDRQSFKSRCLGTPCTAVFVKSASRAGAAYAAFKAQAKEMQVSPEAVQPVDANTCGCVFPGRSARSVRFLLQCHLAGFGLDDLSLAVVTTETVRPGSDDPGASLLEAGRAKLAPAEQALRPCIACLEAYEPVAETLTLLLEEVCFVRPVTDLDAFLSMMADEVVDGVFFDLDGHDAEALAQVRAAAKEAGGGFKVFFSTYAQPGMARTRYGLESTDLVVQKPFESDALAEAVHLQFNLA